MSRIASMFERLRASRRRALIAFLSMGDPSLDVSVELALAAADAGADALELGVPFSDPTADGPVIARASRRAIEGGATLRKVLLAARKIRETSEIPLILFTYYNPVLVTGELEVVRLAKEAGLDAMLVVDLPPEEGAELRAAASASGIAFVPLVAPTSTDERVDAIVRAAVPAGAPPTFVYSVSMAGVTGAGDAPLARAGERAGLLRERTKLPVVVGFGVDGPASARVALSSIDHGPDGVVVGSAIVKLVEEGGDVVGKVRAFVGALRAAIDSP